MDDLLRIEDQSSQFAVVLFPFRWRRQTFDDLGQNILHSQTRLGADVHVFFAQQAQSIFDLFRCLLWRSVGEIDLVDDG